MLGRTRIPLRLRAPLGVPFRQVYRPISISHALLQEQKKQEGLNTTDGAETPKRKPLSRIPIGAIPEGNSQKIGSTGTVEFSTWKAVVLFAVVGTVVTFFFKKEKKRLELQKEADQNRGMGKPLVGGPFDLIDTNGEQFTQEKLKDKFSLIYFGFTHCPDICPDELDKLGLMLDELKSKYNIQIQPIFITCDPARDSPAIIKEYLKDFHPDIIGLTGTYDKIKECCKNFRVYFSTPRDVKAGQDYLVDHSIFFYLMDKEGEFIDVLGRQYDASGAVEKIKGHIDAYVPKDQRDKQKNSWYGFLFK
ncbi:Copper-binding protein [Komagataella phaffii CBS 7435]|uniref:Copper-binding protein of the mitochondrial inner membrane n=2 Tax=Komagataella phaffii TaxID=460519 RepID=C4R781_KOMPG|nr:Copper-binding protein of the mitochondrial inner membrane [Komagataella phaffii GS115]AOA64590.1 GQ67_04548T0 [Komagataella phaffii]CAH2451173.1 Copper-binding protein [Komagataella phaffii CBS 7435]AOA69661.1 GQ68_04520T0 [Komagataella phaffii GS115]CAY71456.1 Copper-binding protein of the mitochondrial inner membrane [Komagataella phaffii GS115]CCA40934.1 Copper-binding protein [Komagataella phaffii CBS 7435]